MVEQAATEVTGRAKRSSGRVPELDVLRFLAAFAVVMYHLTYRPFVNGVINEHTFGALSGVSRFGYLGVNLFFMISGFVILWSSQERTAGEFVISRIARLYPSFWVCMLLTVLVLNTVGTEHIPFRTAVLNLTMVPNFLGAPYVEPLYWTLFVELKFYILVFVVLLTGTMKHVEAWLGLWIACSAACAVGIAPRWVSSAAMYPFGPYFISGCAVYLIRTHGLSAYRITVLLIAATLATRTAVQQQSGFTFDVTVASSVVVAGLIVAFHLAFVAVALAPRILPENRLWYWLGSMTYPLYLSHDRIGFTLWQHLPSSLSPWVSVAIVLVAVFLLAWLIAALVERRVCSAFQRAMLRWAARLRFPRLSPA